MPLSVSLIYNSRNHFRLSIPFIARHPYYFRHTKEGAALSRGSDRDIGGLKLPARVSTLERPVEGPRESVGPFAFTGQNVAKRQAERGQKQADSSRFRSRCQQIEARQSPTI